MSRIIVAIALLFAAMQPAIPQQLFFFVGNTSAPPSCSHSLNFAQACNSVNTDILF